MRARHQQKKISLSVAPPAAEGNDEHHLRIHPPQGTQGLQQSAVLGRVQQAFHGKTHLFRKRPKAAPKPNKTHIVKESTVSYSTRWMAMKSCTIH